VFPLSAVAGASVAAFGWAVWVFFRTAKRTDLAITEAEALNRLSKGFEWHYDHPIVTFVLRDGSLILFERRFGPAGSWYDSRPDRPGPKGDPDRPPLVRTEPRRAELRPLRRRRSSKRRVRLRAEG
jgi:hypothetical protein